MVLPVTKPRLEIHMIHEAGTVSSPAMSIPLVLAAPVFACDLLPLHLVFPFKMSFSALESQVFLFLQLTLRAVRQAAIMTWQRFTGSVKEDPQIQIFAIKVVSHASP